MIYIVLNPARQGFHCLTTIKFFQKATCTLTFNLKSAEQRFIEVFLVF